MQARWREQRRGAAPGGQPELTRALRRPRVAPGARKGAKRIKAAPAWRRGAATCSRAASGSALGSADTAPTLGAIVDVERETPGAPVPDSRWACQRSRAPAHAQLAELHASNAAAGAAARWSTASTHQECKRGACTSRGLRGGVACGSACAGGAGAGSCACADVNGGAGVVADRTGGCSLQDTACGAAR